MTSLTLIRGIPGSGKSTLAKKMLLINGGVHNSHHFEADMYFIGKDGVYNFDINNICDAHDCCQSNTKNMLSWGSDVYVSNTFTTLREMKPYFAMAKAFGIVPSVIHCQGNFDSIHGVPADTLQKMKDRFQYDISSLYN